MTKSTNHDCTGFIRSRKGKFFVDRKKKLSSIISNEIILHEFLKFLKQNYTRNNHGRLLDAGAGTKPYRPVYKNYFASCTSFDVSHSPHNISSVDLIASLDRLPFQKEIFDCILCTEVLEHVPNPVLALKEFYRILKPGGRIFLTTPFLVPLHEMPYDFFRYTPSALKSMAREANLSLTTIITKGEYFAFALQLALFPLKKFWLLISKLFHVPLYHPYNPLVFITIVLPQLLYLVWWKEIMHQKRKTFFTKLYKKLEYITLGYVTTLIKE